AGCYLSLTQSADIELYTLPYTTLFRSQLEADGLRDDQPAKMRINEATQEEIETLNGIGPSKAEAIIQYREEHGYFMMASALDGRSEEHTSELQSRFDLVCRLLLEKKKC